MEIRLHYNGSNYYLFNDFRKEYPDYKYINERTEFLNTTVLFGNKRYISEETMALYLKYIEMEENRFTLYSFIKSIGEEYSHLDDEIEKILNNYISYEIFNDRKYYVKDQLSNARNITDLLQLCLNKKVAACIDLNRLYKSDNINHYELKSFSSYHYRFIYPLHRVNSCFGLEYIDDIEENYKEEFKYRCENSTLFDFFDNYFDRMNEHPETISLMRKFYVLKINKSASNNRSKVAKEYVSKLYEMYNLLDKEITDYSLDDLNVLIDENKTLFQAKFIVQFIDYLRKNNRDFLPDVSSFKVKANNRKLEGEDLLYSPDEYIRMYDASLDLKRHIPKAYADYIYVQYWLIILLYFSNFVRMSDIVNTPVFDIPFEYEKGYFANNEISLKEAQTILDLFALTATNIRIGKTGAKKKISFLEDQKRAVAEAMVICLQFAKENNLKYMFTVKKASAERIYNKMGEPFINVSNRKMNYTLATYLEGVGTESTEYRKDVYRLLSIMRGHKKALGFKPTETTAIYIKKDAQGVDTFRIADNTNQRGAFGWLYHILLTMSNEEFDSLEEETQRILDIQDKYNPDQIEEISYYLEFEKKRRMEVLNTIAGYTSADALNVLQEINNISGFNKDQNFPCLLGKQCHKENASCMYCEYSIKTVHSLITYKNELNLLLKSIENTKELAVVKKNMYLLFKILMVIKDFKDECSDNDKDYINAFIDMNSLKKRMTRLPDQYTYLLQETINGKKY